MSYEPTDAPASAPERTPEEMERIARAAREAKTTILAVAALTIGSIILMFVITIIIVALEVL